MKISALAGGRGGGRSGIIGRPGAGIGAGAGAATTGAALGVVGLVAAAEGAAAGATAGGITGSDNWDGSAAGLASVDLPAAGCGAGAGFGLVSAGLTDAALTDAAFAATGCFSVTFATGVALAAAGGGRFTCAGVAALAGAVGCFAVGRAGLAAVAAGRRGADAAACEADASLPFITLLADAFMPDTFNLCPSNVVNRRLVNAVRITYPDLRHPALTVRLLESAAAFTLRRVHRHLLRPI